MTPTGIEPATFWLKARHDPLPSGTQEVHKICGWDS